MAAAVLPPELVSGEIITRDDPEPPAAAAPTLTVVVEPEPLDDGGMHPADRARMEVVDRRLAAIEARRPPRQPTEHEQVRAAARRRLELLRALRLLVEPGALDGEAWRDLIAEVDSELEMSHKTNI